MLDTELITLADKVIDRRCEMQNIELKAAAKGCPVRLYDTLSSFANQQNGGIIIFGIDQSDDYAICGVYDPHDLQAKVTEQAAQMSPVVRPLFTVADYRGKAIVSAEIAECDLFSKPCFYKGAGRMRGSYVRVGDADMPMTEYEIYSYEAFRTKRSEETRTSERVSAAALDASALSAYQAQLCEAKPKLAGLPAEQIYSLQGMTDGGRPTLAALLLFGIYPQAFLPQLCVTAVAVPGVELGETGAGGERFSDNKRIEGTIPQMLEESLAFVRRNIRRRTIIDDAGARADRYEYPIKAVRELILNALIHRDYSMHTEASPIRIIIFSDRIEIENPGGLYGRLTLDNLGKTGGDTRNPYIAGALEVMGITENRFSGIPTVRIEMDKYGLPEPLFENRRGAFKATLYNSRTAEDAEPAYGGSDMAREILSFCSAPRSRKELAERFGFDSPSYFIKRYVAPLVEEGLIALSQPETPKSKNQRYAAVDTRKLCKDESSI